MMPTLLQAARRASAVDDVAAIASVMPHALAVDPARLLLAKGWLLGVYLPAWVAEARITLNGRNLADIELDAREAWRVSREMARARADTATWPKICDEVRDVVRVSMQGSIEAAVRLPIDDPAWALIEALIWSTVEACVWTVAWRAVESAPGAPISTSIANALMPLCGTLQHSVAPIVLGLTPPMPCSAPAPHVEDGVLFNADADVLAFMREHLPAVKDWGPCRPLGILRDGALIGGVVFNNYHGEIGDIEISAAFTTGVWFRPRTLRRVFAYPFRDLGCRRLTDHVPRKFKAARRFAEKAGFKLEGVKRHAADGRQHLMIYGMLREECRFLKEA